MTTEQIMIDLVAKKIGTPESSVTPEKTFYQLEIDGDDAVELISELCRRYKVPAERIDLNRYIGSKGGGLFKAISFLPSAARNEAPKNAGSWESKT